MKALIKEVTRTKSTDQQIMDYLEAVYPVLGDQLEAPSAWIRLLMRHMMTGEWRVAGQDNRPSSIWSFWKTGLDLAHLEALHAETTRKPVKVEAPVSVQANRFDALNSEDGANTDDETVVEESSNSDTSENEDDQVWAFALANRNRQFAPPASVDSDSDDQDSVSEVDTPPTPLTPYQLDEEALEDRATFLSHFGMAELPKVPTTNRSIEELLDDGDAWRFSKGERVKLAIYLETHAKQDLDENLIAEFERLVEKFQEARQNMADVKDNVRMRVETETELTSRAVLNFSKG